MHPDTPIQSRPAHRKSIPTMIRTLSTALTTTLAAAAITAVSLGAAHAAGGTAVPPLPGFGTIPFLWVAPPSVGPVTVTPALGALQGFTAVGILQTATVSDAKCPGTSRNQQGGTAVINGLPIVIPCNSIVQMPASTFPWSQLFDPVTSSSGGSNDLAPLALDGGGSGGGGKSGPNPGPGSGSGAVRQLPTTEVTIIGNVVSGVHVAGLVFISQQSLNSGTGTITALDYEAGIITIAGRFGDKGVAKLQINDGRGRFSVGQTPDFRFNVDDENPTIRAATGYPMCVPRTDPATTDDPRCPQRNRPMGPNCRNFAAAQIFLPSRQELTATAAGRHCTSFVMGNPIGAGASDPTSTEQAPLEIGDTVKFSGTLHRTQSKTGVDVYSVHTLEANVGIFTEPGTLPAYIAIGEARIGAEVTRFFNNVPQEAPDRLSFDAMTTDVTSIVDLYLVDIDPATGVESQRWVTPFAMTGGRGSVGASGSFADGGITTQFTGPVPGRVRMRANKAIPGLLASPTRYIRAVLRSLCDPGNVNRLAPELVLVAQPTEPPKTVPCLGRAVAANGLRSGQFLAPMAGFLFAEALVPGDPTAPNALWTLGFLVNGEGATAGQTSASSAAGLVPTPW